MSSLFASASIVPSAAANADLERRVVAYLASRNFLSFRRLAVRAHQGVVTLKGRLGSYYERQVAVESARRVAGATRIIDRLLVDTVTNPVPVAEKFARPRSSSDVLVDPGSELVGRCDLPAASVESLAILA